MYHHGTGLIKKTTHRTAGVCGPEGWLQGNKVTDDDDVHIGTAGAIPVINQSKTLYFSIEPAFRATFPQAVYT